MRVFPNKYPPVDGAEVIVESPRHEDAFATIEHAEEVVRAYVDRYRAHRDAAFVSIFKNEGSRAGASIPHAHSQVVPLPFVPPRIERELAGFATGCPLCDAGSNHVIRENESFRWLAPFASSFAYQQWIVPKRHTHEVHLLRDDELRDLASLLRAAAFSTRTIASAFNWMFLNFPTDAGHFYVDVVPRMAAIAGFELNTGTFVEIIDPAAAARRLREEQ